MTRGILNEINRLSMDELRSSYTSRYPMARRITSRGPNMVLESELGDNLLSTMAVML